MNAPSIFRAPWQDPKYQRSYALAGAKKSRQAVKLARSVLPQTNKLIWLDGGSGSGRYAVELLKWMFAIGLKIETIFLTDINAAALRHGFVQQYLAQKEESNLPRVISEPASLDSISFVPDRHVNLYTLNSVMEHLEPSSRSKILKEAQRILTPDGILMITVPLQTPLSRINYFIQKFLGLIPDESIDLGGGIDPTHKDWFTRKTLSKIMQEEGFVPCGTDYYIYRSIRPFWRVWAGSYLQALLPKALRSFLAIGTVVAFRKD